MIELAEWSTVGVEDPYMPPEFKNPNLHGRRPDGSWIRTSPIQKVEGRVVTTRSGNEYKLLEPNPDWVKWLKENDHRLPTEEEPIRIKNECKTKS